MAIRYIQLPFKVLNAVSPRLSARLALAFFTTPRRWPVPAWEQQIASRAEKIRLSTGQEGLSWGRGRPVFLVHGWEGRVTQLGHFVEPLVQRGFRVLGFNAPAHGETAGRALNVLQYAQFLRVVVNDYGPMHGVIAHSMGASALGFAARLPLAVERAVLISTANSVSGVVQWFEDMIALSAPARRTFRDHLETKIFRTRLATLNLSEQVPPFLPRTLLLATDDDRDVPVADTHRLAALWPAQTIITRDAGGHRKLLRDQRVIDAAVGFLTQEMREPSADSMHPRGLPVHASFKPAPAHAATSYR